MNKRARIRLIVVTIAIVVIAVAAYFVLQGSGQSLLSVADMDAGKVDAGTRVKVTGVVVDDSWNGSANPMRFEMKDEGTEGPMLAVVYGGTVPSGFGNRTVATVTGRLLADGTFEATELMTQCPSKYKSQKPVPVDELLADRAVIVDVTVRITGVVVGPPSGGRLTLASSAESTATLEVIYSGEPVGLADGATVEAAGQLGRDGVFKATGVTVTKQPGAS